MLNALDNYERKKKMTITKIKKELIKEINRTRNNLSSCVCKQGYTDITRVVNKLFKEDFGQI